MDAQITSAVRWFRRIYLDAVPTLLREQSTSFLSFLCVVAATDAIAGYRYSSGSVGARFTDFTRCYFPPAYTPHADNLYTFRCRMLHNFSPAHFSLVHASPADHLQRSNIGDTVLDDRSFFEDFQAASERYFTELQGDTKLQADILARLKNLAKGGSVWVQ